MTKTRSGLETVSNDYDTDETLIRTETNLTANSNMANMATNSNMANMATNSNMANMATNSNQADMATNSNMADMGTISNMASMGITHSNRPNQATTSNTANQMTNSIATNKLITRRTRIMAIIRTYVEDIENDRTTGDPLDYIEIINEHQKKLEENEASLEEVLTDELLQLYMT